MRCSPNAWIDRVCRGTARRAPTKGLLVGAAVLVLLAGCARAPVIPSAPLTVTAEELVILLREREIAVQTLKAQFAVEASGSALEVARQDLFDVSGALQATMVYLNYRAVGSTAAGPLTWPTRVQAEDGLGRTKLVLTFHDVIPNPELTSQDWGSVEVRGDQ